MGIILEVCERGGAQVREHKYKAGEVNICCPFCIERGHEGEDTKFLLGINTLTHKAHCYRCEFKATGLRRILQELTRVWGLASCGVREILTHEEVVVPPPKENKPEPTGLPEEFETFQGLRDRVARVAFDYLKSRSVSVYQVTRHKIGFAAWGTLSYRVVFPVFDKTGSVYGYAARAFVDGMKPKYLNATGTKLLWNGDTKGHTAVELEGVMDALSVERALGDEPGIVAVSSLGSATTDTQMEQLVKFSQVILFPDRDQAGVKAAIRKAKKYSQFGLLPRVVVPEVLDGRDPGEMSRQEIRSALAGARQWNQNTEYRLRAAKEL